MARSTRRTEDYIRYLADIVSDDRFDALNECREFIDVSYGMEFTFEDRMDENRDADGRRMRWYFEYDTGKKAPLSEDECPSSIFEMMVALSLKGYEQFLSGYSSSFGYSPSFIFQFMLESLGILTRGRSKNSYYIEKNESKIEKILCDFCEKNFEKNGKGSLFLIKGSKIDFREYEIWWQMINFINDLTQK